MRSNAADLQHQKPVRRSTAETAAEENDIDAAQRSRDVERFRTMNDGSPIDPHRATVLQRTIGNRALQRMISNQIAPRGFGDNEAMDVDPTPMSMKDMAEGLSAPPSEAVQKESMSRVMVVPKGEAKQVMRAVTPGKVFKKVGLGIVNLAAETFIGPLADLKNAIRLIWERKDSAKVKKVKDRVKEEWVGEYGTHTWMKVLHVITTLAEKLGGLAGAIALLATLASIAMPAAAPVAAVAGVVGVAFASLAFIIRSILAGASLYFYKKGDSDMKKMAITNFVGAIGNLLGVISFGVGVGVSGGLNFDAQTTTSAGRDIGLGMGFSTSTKIASVTTDLVQNKRDSALMRDPKEDQKGGSSNPNVIELAKALNEADELLPEVKKGNVQDREGLSQDEAKYGKLETKFGKMTGKSQELEAKSNEMKAGVENAESEDAEPKEGEEAGYKEKDVAEMELHLDTGDTWAAKEDVTREEAETEAEKVKGKMGFFSRLKKGLKKIGKKISGAFTNVGARVKTAFARFKALLGKIKLKLVQFILKATGLNEKVAQAQADFREQQAELPQYAANIEENETMTAKADAKLKEFR